jgi:hypothetical protein
VHVFISSAMFLSCSLSKCSVHISHISTLSMQISLKPVVCTVESSTHKPKQLGITVNPPYSFNTLSLQSCTKAFKLMSLSVSVLTT